MNEFGQYTHYMGSGRAPWEAGESKIVCALDFRAVTQYSKKVYIVACEAHSALVKIGLVFVPPFIFDSPLARIHVFNGPCLGAALRTGGLLETGMACDNIFSLYMQVALGHLMHRS